MKTWLIFLAFAVFLSKSFALFPSEFFTDIERHNLKKCFNKLHYMDIKPANVTYSKLANLGTTYEQYYCRINEHSPHPYWQSEMTFLDHDCHKKDKCYLGKLEVKMVLTMIPIQITTRYLVNATDIPGVFSLEEEITGGNKRLMAVLRAKDGLLIYYICSCDSWNYNDFHLNTDDKYPGGKSFARNIGMPDYFKWDWWNWWSWGSWWGGRGNFDHDGRRRNDRDSKESNENDSHDSSDQSHENDDPSDESHENDHHSGESHKNDHHSGESHKNDHHSDESRRDNDTNHSQEDNDKKNGSHHHGNDTHHGGAHDHKSCEDHHKKHHKSCDDDHWNLKRRLRSYVKCDHCDYFRVQQMPWWGWKLTLTKKMLRDAVEIVDNGLFNHWDMLTWPYDLFYWPSWTREGRSR